MFIEVYDELMWIFFFLRNLASYDNPSVSSWFFILIFYGLSFSIDELFICRILSSFREARHPETEILN